MSAELCFLTDEQLRLATAVLDVIIPPEGERPGAGGAGGAKRLDAILAERPDIRRPVLDALRAIDIAAGARGFLARDSATRPDVLRTVEAAQPEAFTVLVTQTYNAHYTCPKVRRDLGFTPENPQPEGFMNILSFNN